MTTTDILSHRMHNQQLSQTQFGDPVEVVKWFGAMQSQDYAGAKWGLGQRVPHASDEPIEKLFNEGKILRTHVMRPTWHFVHPEDIRWMLQLTGPRVTRVMASYNKKLELTPEIFSMAHKTISKILTGGKQLTRQEIKIELEKIGVKTDVQRLGHIVGQAELDSIICSGPRRGKQFTYMLLEERVPKTKSISLDEALCRLLEKYFQSHGPATIKDFVWWSGLTVTDAKRGIELLHPKIQSQSVGSKTYFFFDIKPKPIPEKAFLLPNYDEYGIAYTEREAFFRPEYNELLNSRGNATFQHLIMYKGHIIGTWKRIMKKDTVDIETNYFEKSSKEEIHTVTDAAKGFGEFLKTTVNIS